MATDVVREIQEALRLLAAYDARLLPITVDGIYGSETTRAVSIFQGTVSLPVTGEVDDKTFRRLIDDAKIISDVIALPIPVFLSTNHLLRPYEQTPLVPFLKLMLLALSDNYQNVPPTILSDIYDNDAVNAVKLLQRLHNLQEDGIVDVTTWNTIVSLYAERPSINTPSMR